MTSIEKILINSEEYIRKLFEGVPIPIYVWQHHDNDFILVDYNIAADNETDGKIKKKSGIKASDFYKNNPRIIQDLNLCFSNKQNTTKELEYIVKSNQEVQILSIKYSFIPPELVLVHVENITKKILAEQQLKKSEMKLKQLNKELGQKVKERTVDLEESEANYRDLIDNLDVGFYQVTLDGHMINHNLAHKTILGYEPSDNLKDKDVRMFWQYPEQREEYINQLLKKGNVKDYICHSLTKDGKKIIVQLNSHLIRDKMGNPIRIDGRFMDITEKYKLEQKIKESEEKYRLISENANDIISVQDGKFKLEYVNEGALNKILGYKNEDIIGKMAIKFAHPDDREKILNDFMKIFEEKEVITEGRLKHKNGKDIWAEFNGKLFYDENKEPKFLLITRDITERIVNAEKIQKSEQILRQFIEESYDGLVLTDNEGFILEWNKGQEKIFGLSKNEVVGKPVWDIFLHFIPHDKKNQMITNRLKDLVIQSLRKGDAPFLNKLQEFEIISTNNIAKVIQQLPFLIKVKEGYMFGAIIRDITEKKTAEQKLKESEEKYRYLFERSPFSIILTSLEGTIMDINSATEKLIGYKKDELIGKKYVKLPIIHQEYLPSIIERFNKLLKGEPLPLKDIQIYRKDDKLIWTRIHSSLVNIENQSFIQVIGYDLTDKKIAEQAIRESEEKYRTVVEKSLQGICILQDFKIIFVNNALAEILGYTVKELYSMSNEEVVNLIYIEDREFVFKRHQERLNGKKVPSHYIFRIIRKDNQIRWVDIYASLIEYNGKPAVQEVFIDITDKKLAEEKLKESEAKYRAMTELLPDIIYEADLKLNITYVNKVGYKKFGYTPEDLKRGVSIKNLVSPEYVEKAFLTIKSIFNKNITEPNEYLMVRKDGTKFYARLNSRSIIKNEKVVGLRGTVTDINDMVIAEQKLKESENRLLERVKELNCLYEISKIAENPNISYKEFILETLRLIPSAWQTPEITCARIIYEDTEYKTKWFKESKWKLATNIEINKKPMDIEVFSHNRVQFLKEEKYLIKEIGKRLKTIIEKNISEKKLKESEKRYRDAYDRASFYKDIFAHDINNILQIMNSSAELISLQLRDPNLSEDIENITGIIKKQVNRGTKLVNNVRILSELEESEIPIQDIEVYDLLLKSIEYVKKAYTERDINIQIDYSDNEINVIANELLQDVFENILINAIKYNENPTIEILIKIVRQTYENNAFYRFEFMDNGIGVDDKRKEFIFTRGNGDSKSSKGMGLGLSLVSKIIQYYNGKIWVEDKVNGDYSQGSNFILLLPEAI